MCIVSIFLGSIGDRLWERVCLERDGCSWLRHVEDTSDCLWQTAGQAVRGRPSWPLHHLFLSVQLYNSSPALFVHLQRSNVLHEWRCVCLCGEDREAVDRGPPVSGTVSVCGQSSPVISVSLWEGSNGSTSLDRPWMLVCLQLLGAQQHQLKTDFISF